MFHCPNAEVANEVTVPARPAHFEAVPHLATVAARYGLACQLRTWFIDQAEAQRLVGRGR